MRYLLEKNVENSLKSFTILQLDEAHFDKNWHFHPHYQIFTVLKSEGTRFVGDQIQSFKEGDTVFLGPNIPHLWLNDKPYFEANSSKKAQGIVLYFKEDFLGKDFLQIPEAAAIRSTLQKSERGLVFGDKAARQIMQKLQTLLHATGFEAVIGVLELLQYLANSTDYSYISSANYTNTYRKSETERMQKVHEYVVEHFKNEIKLETIAAYINMTEPAFCRYFKKRTNKTFSEFVTAIRIGHACKQLELGSKNIAEIGFESGFNTLSHFNKQFKETLGYTPSQYKKLNTF